MTKLLAVLIVVLSSPALASEKCETFIAPAHSRYAGDTLQFLPEGRIAYNGEVSPKLFARRCADGFSICIKHGSSMIVRTEVMGGLRYITLFENGLETERLPWHSIIEDCHKGKPA